MISVTLPDLDAFALAVDRLARMHQFSDELSGRLQLVLQEDNRVGILNNRTGGYGATTVIPTKYRVSSGGVDKYGPSGMYRKRTTKGPSGTTRTSISYSLIPRDYRSHSHAVSLQSNMGGTLYGTTRIFGSMQSTFYDPTPKDSNPDLYEMLDGPPLAPNWEQSRIISNYKTYDMTTSGTSRVETVSQWEDITNEKGESFMMDHFVGRGKAPKRDMRGLRPWGYANAEAQVLYFVADLEEGVVT